MLDIISSRFFLGPAQRRLFERGLPVLTFHGVGDPPAGADLLSEELDRFSRDRIYEEAVRGTLV